VLYRNQVWRRGVVKSSTMLMRKRAVLGLLLALPARPSRLQLVKLLFLARHETDLAARIAFYDFLPYRYGPFSFTLYRELEELRADGLVDGKRPGIPPSVMGRARRQVRSLSLHVRRHLDEIIHQHGRKSEKALVHHVYTSFPEFASRSELVSTRSRPVRARPAVYTTGYEGRSIDAFLSNLIVRGIRRVVDVRQVSRSRKYGFSGKVLEGMLSRVDVEYRHVPELGIPAPLRRGLLGQADYDRLFVRYRRQILPKEHEAVQEVSDLVNERASVLLCFEKDPRQCHRTHLARAIARGTGLKHVPI
jgi:uncharacterized protein (DUF488 family)